jgi:hypothetical protein
MPLVDLTDLELETAARGCRAIGHQASQDAQKIGDPRLRGQKEGLARRASALAEKFESARAQKR